MANYYIIEHSENNFYNRIFIHTYIFILTDINFVDKSYNNTYRCAHFYIIENFFSLYIGENIHGYKKIIIAMYICIAEHLYVYI